MALLPSKPPCRLFAVDPPRRFEICLYPLLSGNRVVSPLPVPVQNRRTVLPGIYARRGI